MRARTIHKLIQVHPPEANAIAKAFDEVRTASNTALSRLKKIYGTLNQEWEGNQKTRFIGESEGTINHLQNILLPSLTNWEHKYRIFLADKTIEAVEYY